MNIKADNQTASHPDSYRSLQILDELSNNDALTQRDLSKRLGIALGLVNSYIKNLVKKGYITVAGIPPKRYAYYLTPKGFAEKTRLTYDLLHDYTRIYREARKNLSRLFEDLGRNGAKRVVFAGADEVAEIAYLSLQEFDIEFSGVLDTERKGQPFFGKTIRSLDEVASLKADAIIITTYLRRNNMLQDLIRLGVPRNKIHTLFIQ